MNIGLTVIMTFLGILTLGLNCCAVFQILKDFKNYWCNLENKRINTIQEITRLEEID
jgi:hypothetical protein